MKKFTFRLEPVLRVRALHKKLAEREVAHTLSRLAQTQEELEQNEENYRRSFQTNTQGATSSTSMFWEINHRYRNHLLTRRDQLNDRINALNEQLAAEKKKLTRKMKDEMVIEKLQEYQRQEHQRQLENTVQQEIEEIDLLKRGNKK